MPEPLDPKRLEAQADEKVRQILAAAASWARELPAPLAPAVRAVCIRLGEMVADQRHYLAPLPEPQESERAAVLTLLAQRLASSAVSSGLEKELATLSEMELKSTASWALVPGAQAEWNTTAIRYLESASDKLPPADRPDPYWAEDVVAGVIASVRAVVGIDELQARTESRYSGGVKVIRDEDAE
jgi:hypothetical protein